MLPGSTFQGFGKMGAKDSDWVAGAVRCRQWLYLFRSSSIGLPFPEPLAWEAARRSLRWQAVLTWIVAGRCKVILDLQKCEAGTRRRGGPSAASQAYLWIVRGNAVRLG